ncbi:hypothetical protein ACIG5E_10925 [Kitasatospora sp. NPDC053057]|uniref:hypothetical protein n=1 Tax=Kitasatospora sp. NPDC053057 TaxID=3364062 RepID=UPI0037C5DEFE
MARRRDDWNTALLRAATRWSGRADRCAGWTRQGVERCRRWAREGAQRPGELAPPSWFAIALPFGIAWYRALGGTARAWCRVGSWSYRVLGRALSGPAGTGG